MSIGILLIIIFIGFVSGGFGYMVGVIVGFRVEDNIYPYKVRWYGRNLAKFWVYSDAREFADKLPDSSILYGYQSKWNRLL